MSDLTDERLDAIDAGVWHRQPHIDEIQRMVAEIRRHRAAVRADRERVRNEVRKAAVSALEASDHYLTDAPNSQAVARVSLAHVIADRTANALAFPAPALTAERVRGVVRENTLSVLEDQSATVVRGGGVLRNGTKERRQALEFCADVIASRAADRLAGAPSSEAAEVAVCPSCHNEIDPDCCHCGVELSRHLGEEHGFVPMGCDCGREPDTDAQPSSEAQRGVAAMLTDWLKHEEKTDTCLSCKQWMAIPSELDPSPMCDPCAQKHVLELAQDVAGMQPVIEAAIAWADSFTGTKSHDDLESAVNDYLAAHRKAP